MWKIPDKDRMVWILLRTYDNIFGRKTKKACFLQKIFQMIQPKCEELNDPNDCLPQGQPNQSVGLALTSICKRRLQTVHQLLGVIPPRRHHCASISHDALPKHAKCARRDLTKHGECHLYRSKRQPTAAATLKIGTPISIRQLVVTGQHKASCPPEIDRRLDIPIGETIISVIRAIFIASKRRCQDYSPSCCVTRKFSSS